VVTETSSRENEANDGPRILIAEDDAEIADLYAAYLSEYQTNVVYRGDNAIERLSRDLDVILLDRRMPMVSGNEVLAAIEEAGIDCRVVMVAATATDSDVIDLRVDDYLTKPVTRAQLRGVVERLLTLDEYNDRIRELTSKKLKRNVLEVENMRSPVVESAEFEQLQAEIAGLESEVNALADKLDHTESEYD
jgi:DNA-binding response OmpR family regulator